MIAERLKTYENALQLWAQKDKGKCLIAKDKAHLWEMLFTSASGLNVLVWFVREVPRGEPGIAPRTGKVDQHFQAVFTRGAGFKVKPGDSLTEGTGGGRPMFELVEEGRDLIRTLILPDARGADRVADYAGIDLLDVGGTDLRVDAYVVDWSVGGDIGQLRAGTVEEV